MTKEVPACNPLPVLCFAVQMGLQSGATHVAIFLFVLATFSGGGWDAPPPDTIPDFVPRGVRSLCRTPAPLTTQDSAFKRPLLLPNHRCAALGAMSLAVTVGSKSAGQASLVLNITLLVSVVVSGMLVNPDTMPDWIGWMHYVSIFFWAYSALMINEMSGIKVSASLRGVAVCRACRRHV